MTPSPPSFSFPWLEIRVIKSSQIRAQPSVVPPGFSIFRTPFSSRVGLRLFLRVLFWLRFFSLTSVPPCLRPFPPSFSPRHYKFAPNRHRGDGLAEALPRVNRLSNPPFCSKAGLLKADFYPAAFPPPLATWNLSSFLNNPTFKRENRPTYICITFFSSANYGLPPLMSGSQQPSPAPCKYLLEFSGRIVPPELLSASPLPIRLVLLGGGRVFSA